MKLYTEEQLLNTVIAVSNYLDDINLKRAQDNIEKHLKALEPIKELSKEVNIILNEWDYTCSDGCCYDYGVDVIVNGEEMEYKNEDIETILTQVFEHLGYKVNIEKTFNKK